MSQTSIQARDLSMRYQERTLFHIPKLSLGPQQAVYLSGANGVGKTTLLKILSGLVTPTTGQVNVKRGSLFARLLGFDKHTGAIYMHQTPYMFDSSVFDNVAYGLKYSLKDTRKLRTKVIKALRLVGLETLADEHISVLSGGERQRVAMARAWILKPGILLMDESSASMDAESVERQVILAHDLLNRGSTLVITSHQQNALTALCSRHWILSQTQLIERADLKLIDTNEENYAIA